MVAKATPETSLTRRLRVGIDVGGTHTDVAVLNESHGVLGAVKVATGTDLLATVKRATQYALKACNAGEV